MTLYGEGHAGEPVRDIQERLSRLGYDVADPPGQFGASTKEAVLAFQQAHHLNADGLVGRETWRTLVDAGFALGDRLLYYRMPMFHGHDVAELQRRLNSLGFDAGNVDGIFGAATLRAVLEFQHNRLMVEDGIVGPEVLSDLGLMARATDKVGRHEVRERVWLDQRPRTVAGQRIFLDPFCRDHREATTAWAAAVAAADSLRSSGGHPILSRSVDTRPAERLRARHANEMAPDIVVGFALSVDERPGVHFFASSLGESAAGAAIATAVAAGFGVETVGRATPLLRETRAPAIVVVLPSLDATTGHVVAGRLEAWMCAPRAVNG